jgi:hypothetical protein
MLIMKSNVNWDVTRSTPVSFLSLFFDLKMVEICSSEIWVNFQLATQRYIPEERIFQTRLLVTIKKIHLYFCIQCRLTMPLPPNTSLHLLCGLKAILKDPFVIHQITDPKTFKFLQYYLPRLM